MLNDLAAQRDSIDRIVLVASGALALIAGISLVVGGLAVSSSVGTAVHTRRREIGIKKSLGAPPSVIVKEFLAQILFTSLGAALTGTLFSGLGCWLLAHGVRAAAVIGSAFASRRYFCYNRAVDPVRRFSRAARGQNETRGCIERGVEADEIQQAQSAAGRRVSVRGLRRQQAGDPSAGAARRHLLHNAAVTGALGAGGEPRGYVGAFFQAGSLDPGRRPARAARPPAEKRRGSGAV